MNTCLPSNVGNDLQLCVCGWDVWVVCVCVCGGVVWDVCGMRSGWTYLQQLDTAWVSRMDKETLKIWFKHVLKRNKRALIIRIPVGRRKGQHYYKSSYN